MLYPILALVPLFSGPASLILLLLVQYAMLALSFIKQDIASQKIAGGERIGKGTLQHLSRLFHACEACPSSAAYPDPVPYQKVRGLLERHKQIHQRRSKEGATYKRILLYRRAV